MWHEATGPADADGVRYPALDPETACLDQPPLGAGAGCPRLPYLSVGSLLEVRNECTGSARVLPVSGCAATAQIFCDRCVTCGTSPRGRVADLPMASFVALGGDLERGCFNATVSLGIPGTDRTFMISPEFPATLWADLQDIQPPLIAGILLGGSLAKLGRVLHSGSVERRPGARLSCSRSGSAVRWPCSCARSSCPSGSHCW